MTRQSALRWAGLITLLYLCVQLAGLSSIGLTDDDDFYIPAGASYASWFASAFTTPGEAFSKRGVDKTFTINHEHPPVAKYVFGICGALFSPIFGPVDAPRVGTLLFSTLTAWLLMWLSILHLGPRRGLFAGGLGAAFMLTLPRFYLHSHAATLDVPVAALYFASVAYALVAERRPWAALWAGVLFGLATATKLNAPFLVLPYLLFIAITRWGSRTASKVAENNSATQAANTAGSWPTPPIPAAALSMAIIGPAVFFAVWPWMWFDTAQRVADYVSFHLHHYGIYFLYFGRIFSKHPYAPWHAPFVMAALTVPLATSLLSFIGVGLGGPRLLRRLRQRRRADHPARREADLVLMLLLQALAAILVVALFDGPKYGGAKLFMPIFPFLCLLAGYGALKLLELSKGCRNRRLALAAAAAAAAASVVMTASYRGYALSEYNALAGGLSGATATGFERQYYDMAYRDLVAWLNDNAEEGARVHFLPNNWEYERTYRWYHKAGLLRADIRVVKRPAQANLLILTHERRFARYGQDLLRYRDRSILKERMIDGVPLWTVLKLR